MRILHICTYYIGSKLYLNLMKQLSLQGMEQEVFIPIRMKEHQGKNQLPPRFSNVTYYYRNILRTHDKILFLRKIKKQMIEVENAAEDLQQIDFIHAHTIFSDGGTAYRLHQKYGIDYLVNVRNADINTFYKYGIHLRPFMYKVLLNAREIVFISHAYQEKLLALLPKSIVAKIKHKCFCIPNGIDEYWHEHAVPKVKKESFAKDIKLLFIGLIDKNKNLSAVISTCRMLKDEGCRVSLHVIGNGPLEDECKRFSQRLGLEKEVIFHGFLEDKSQISAIMDQSDIFVMPSFAETFGLVYIEAMSRGLPVIYTRGQGIDGFFQEGEIGYSVEPDQPAMIAESIKKITARYSEISESCYQNIGEFRWGKIAHRYIELYQEEQTHVTEPQLRRI